MESLIQKILLQNKNEKHLGKKIIEFVGENCCQKCYKNSKEPLIIVISFDKSKGCYNFTDLSGANYKLKKFCKKCIYSRASQAKIYIEVD
jgi:hypothetical protein